MRCQKGNAYQAGWAGLALDALVDVCRSYRWALILASHAAEGDVVADYILCDIDAVLEQAASTVLTRCRDAAVGNDLVRSGLYDIFSVKVEGLLLLPPLVVV